jgi:hypothetical protein
VGSGPGFGPHTAALAPAQARALVTVKPAVQGDLEPVKSTDRGSSSQGTVGTVSTVSTPHPRAEITPAGKSPCEVARELRDPTPNKRGFRDSGAKAGLTP